MLVLTGRETGRMRFTQVPKGLLREDEIRVLSSRSQRIKGSMPCSTFMFWARRALSKTSTALQNAERSSYPGEGERILLPQATEKGANQLN